MRLWIVFIFSEPEPLSMEALELDWIDCYGYDNGLAFAQAFGGTAPYTFSWDNGTWLGNCWYFNSWFTYCCCYRCSWMYC